MSAGVSCAVTGAGGYVGSRIAGHFRDEGWQVHELRRRPEQGDHIPYSLETGVGTDSLRGMDALIHCAYDFRAVRWPDIVRINVDGSARLFEAARQAGVTKIVCVSTISAFPGCRSLYGRAKLAIEDAAARHGAVILRPGLVHGEQPGGTLGALDRLVSRSPLVPLVGRGQYPQYLVHEQDLCRLVHRISTCEGKGEGGPFPVAAEDPWTLRSILEALARRRGKRVAFMPIPCGLVLALLRAMEAVGLRPGFRSDSLISLMHQNPHPDFGPTRGWDISFREFGS